MQHFLYVIGLLVVFILGYMMGEQNVAGGSFSATNAEGAVTKPALRSAASPEESQSENVGAAATENTVSATASTTSSSMPYNISFDSIDCATYPGSKTPFLQLVSYNSNASKLQGSTYYVSKVSQKIMSLEPQAMMKYVINATTTAPGELFVDIGGNIGMYTLSALTLGIPILSVEPIAYNLERLSEGYRKNMETVNPPDAAQFTLLKAAVANEAKAEMNISHPTAAFGKQDQSSLFANTIGVVRKPVLEIETVPLLRLDQVIPANVPIGFVKIDVQGAEYWVLEGMRGLLERKSGFPKMVWYEEQAHIVRKAGIAKLGQNQAYLESFGYQCRSLGNDILCQKERA
jgi:FkbM family methyltransferase